jgi:hypothetical protein
MALLAIQGMAMSTAAAALPSHNHGAVSSSVSTSSYALAASAAFPRVRAAFAVGAVTSAAVTPVLDGKLSSYLFASFFCLRFFLSGTCQEQWLLFSAQ